MGRKITRAASKKNSAPALPPPDLSDELIATLSSPVAVVTPAFPINKLDSQARATKGVYTAYLG